MTTETLSCHPPTQTAKARFRGTELHPWGLSLSGETFPEAPRRLPLISHWPGLSHMATPPPNTVQLWGWPFKTHPTLGVGQPGGGDSGQQSLPGERDRHVVSHGKVGD